MYTPCLPHLTSNDGPDRGDAGRCRALGERRRVRVGHGRGLRRRRHPPCRAPWYAPPSLPPPPPSPPVAHRASLIARRMLRDGTSLAASTFTEIIHTASNDPSVGLVFVHDHVRRSLPAIAERKVRRAKADSTQQKGRRGSTAMERWRRHVRGERDGKDARARVRRARAMLRCGVRAQRSGLPRSFRVDFGRIPRMLTIQPGLRPLNDPCPCFRAACRGRSRRPGCAWRG